MRAWHGRRQYLLGRSVTLCGPAVLGRFLRDKWRNRLRRRCKVRVVADAKVGCAWYTRARWERLRGLAEVMSSPDGLAGYLFLLRVTEACDGGCANAVLSSVRGGRTEDFPQPGIFHGGDDLLIRARQGGRTPITKDHDAVDMSTDH